MNHIALAATFRYSDEYIDVQKWESQEAICPDFFIFNLFLNSVGRKCTDISVSEKLKLDGFRQWWCLFQPFK